MKEVSSAPSKTYYREDAKSAKDGKKHFMSI